MAGRTPFGEQLQKRLNPIFAEAGFKVSRTSEEPFDLVIYTRPIGEGQIADKVTFHGEENELCELRGENEIYADAISGDPIEHLFRLKDLVPKYSASSDWREYSVWTYSTKDELEKCLDEIADIVEHRLLAWFENPTNNPNG